MKLEIQPIQINNLHSKLYLNEKRGIITSLNLTRGSNNSLDIGYKTETDVEYDQLFSFYSRFLKPADGYYSEPDKETPLFNTMTWLELVSTNIQSICDYKVRSYYHENRGYLTIENRKFQFSLVGPGKRLLAFSTILGEKQKKLLIDNLSNYRLQYAIPYEASKVYLNQVDWRVREGVQNKEDIREIVNTNNNTSIVSNISDALTFFIRSIHKTNSKVLIDETFLRA